MPGKFPPVFRLAFRRTSERSWIHRTCRLSQFGVYSVVILHRDVAVSWRTSDPLRSTHGALRPPDALEASTISESWAQWLRESSPRRAGAGASCMRILQARRVTVWPRSPGGVVTGTSQDGSPLVV